MSKAKSLKSEAGTLNWRPVAADQIVDCRVFRVRHQRSADPRDGREHDFYCIEAPDWINVIPITAEGKVVLIEQFRHGTNEVTLEIPGGMIDQAESPANAAARELLEETGYASRELDLLGSLRPNPAIQNNWLHIFLARDCVFAQAPQLDGSEHIVVRLVPLEEVPALIASGAIDHALVVAAFYHVFVKERSG